MLPHKKVSSHRTSGRVVVPALVLAVIILLVGGGGYWYVTRDLPWVDVLKDQKAYPGTKIYSDDNVLLGEIKFEKGVPVSLKKVPKNLVQAIVAVEDAHFFRHHGLDYVGMLRALLTNIWAGGVRQGGSTITQQLAKIMFLTPERTFSRKIREVILARRIEAQLTKDEILDLYLGLAPYGGNLEGVRAASLAYFGKEP
ncbi:MAG: transglycosylase domain-containing protein, partial [Nitrospirae bacterium]|nr:transglycosylase domain-containing protein [Nitrospirota bacterium]